MFTEEPSCCMRARGRKHPRTLNELKTVIPVYTKNISQADLQNVFAEKSNAREHFKSVLFKMKASQTLVSKAKL